MGRQGEGGQAGESISRCPEITGQNEVLVTPSVRSWSCPESEKRQRVALDSARTVRRTKSFIVHGLTSGALVPASVVRGPRTCLHLVVFEPLNESSPSAGEKNGGRRSRVNNTPWGGGSLLGRVGQLCSFFFSRHRGITAHGMMRPVTRPREAPFIGGKVSWPPWKRL